MDVDIKKRGDCRWAIAKNKFKGGVVDVHSKVESF